MGIENSHNYQHFLGNPIAKPPCRMLNAMMFGFFVEGEQSRIQEYVDHTLNTVDTSEYRFEAFTSWCLLSFTDIENIASKVEPFASYGFMQETDVIIWVPVAQINQQTNKTEHLHWYPAFIAVNNINALINGREIWGYNKYLCKYEMPNKIDQADFFSLSLDTFKNYNPNTQMSWAELFSIKREADHDTWLEEALEVGKDIAHLFKDGTDALSISGDLIKQFLHSFRSPQLDQILFKQLPDGFAEKSLYSAVISSPSEVKKIHNIGFLKDEYKVTFNQVDAYPLEDMFGIKVGTQYARLPYYVVMDFDQTGATEIIKAK